MQVVTDMAEIEMALAPFCLRLSHLGAPYRSLRAMRWVGLFVCVGGGWGGMFVCAEMRFVCVFIIHVHILVCDVYIFCVCV